MIRPVNRPSTNVAAVANFLSTGMSALPNRSHCHITHLTIYGCIMLSEQDLVKASYGRIACKLAIRDGQSGLMMKGQGKCN